MYTRNRAFRLYGSSKHGKSAVLLPTPRTASRYLPEAGGRGGGGDRGEAGTRPEAEAAAPSPSGPAPPPPLLSLPLFLDSLASHVDSGSSLLRSCGISVGIGVGIGIGIGCTAAGTGGPGPMTASRGQQAPGQQVPSSARRPRPFTFTGRGGSPYPLADAHARYLGSLPPPLALGPEEAGLGVGAHPHPRSSPSSAAAPGRIRCWQLHPPSGLMSYSMSRSRYCSRVGREHKSNGIFFTFDLRGGVAQQRCYDPDCRGYAAPATRLPQEVLDEYDAEQAAAAEAADEMEAMAAAERAAGQPDQGQGPAAAGGCVVDAELEEETEEERAQLLQAVARGEEAYYAAKAALPS